MKNFKTMMAILIMATTGMVFATGDTAGSYTSTNTDSNNSTDNSADNSQSTASGSGDNSGAYESGAFNFSEYSDQEVHSDISGNAVVHGDTSANVAGNQNNCYEMGACVNGSNGGVIQTLTGASGSIIDGGLLGGQFITLEVPVFTYVEQFSNIYAATKADVTQALLEDPESTLALGDALGGDSVGFQKVQETYTADDAGVKSGEHKVGEPKTKPDSKWVAYNSTEVSLKASENNLAAQKIAANANTTQTIKSAPSMGAPSINASNSDMCRHGVSAAASMIGMGFSGGVTLIDKNCELIKQVRLLSNLGLSDVALALLGQDSRVAKAMLQADPERYGQFLNAETVRDIEAESANAEAKVNGEEVKYQNADADQVIIDQSREGSDDNKQAKDVGANGFPTGDLLNLPIFNWLN